MEKFGNALRMIFTLAIVLATANLTFAQCGKFNDSPDGDAALKSHSIYRTYMTSIKKAEDLAKLKAEDFDVAFDNWKKAYEAAPAADGKRPSHWRDGRKFYAYKIMNEEDKTKQKEYYDIIMKLYDEEQACYKTKGIPAYALGRKAFDMFYGVGKSDAKLRSSYDETAAVLDKAIEVGGNDTEYIVLDPYARVVVYQFTNEKMDKETARGIHTKLNAIADHNIANNAKLKAQYEYAKSTMNQVFAQIERNIFDCEYFVNKYKPLYEDKQGDEAFLIEAVTAMKQTGCTTENSPFLASLEEEYAGIIAKRNAAAMAEYEANNPEVVARKLIDAGDFSGAISKYEEAISNAAGDNEKAGLYYYKIGQIKGKKQRSFSGGMAAARKAAELRPDWGEPLLLIGDLYVSNSKSCGDAFKQKCAYIAAVDKYRQAKSVDAGVADKANEKIGRYNSTRPEKENAFMQGYKEGQTISLPCIGTSIQLRF